MLKISTKGRYGLRAMIELARAYEKGPTMMSAITDRQSISRKYLHALLTSLKTAGLVSAIRGAKGGFVLARAPETIMVSEICEALEGQLSVVDCVVNENLCDRLEICETRNIWTKLNNTMLKVLQETKLSELVTDSPNFSSAKDGCAPAPRKPRAPK